MSYQDEIFYEAAGGDYMKISIFTADCVGNAKNCMYPHEKEITNAAQLATALTRDHTCGHFRGNYRSIGNFIGSDVIVMDFDNDGSDDPEDWKTPQMIVDMMPDVSLAITPSRHNMIPKDGKAPRPKGHVYFPIEYMEDAEKYAAIKRGIQEKYPFFDGNALDAARFIFGADMSESDILWQDGWCNIDDVVQPQYETKQDAPDSKGVIPQGSHNKTLSRFAGRILKKLGNCDKAQQVFLDEAAKCETPLPDTELDTIWNSALKFYRNTVSKQSGYVPPDQYNDDFGGRGGDLKPDDYSDIGEAKALVAEYGDELKYTDATDYLRYDGDCWRDDKQMTVGATEEFLDLQLADAEGEVERTKKALMSAGVTEAVINAGGKKLEKQVTDAGGDSLKLFFAYLGAVTYLSFVKKRRDYKYIVSTMNAAKPMIAMSVNDLDRDGMLLNTPYATFDLTKGIMGERPHDPADLITKITDVSPGSEGRDIWLKALDTFFCGNQELIDYVQEIVGMAAVGKVYQEHLIIAYGDGANGKSTLPECVRNAIDAYREENNWLGHFISDCCDTDPVLSEKSGELYQQYRAYCLQTGEYTRSTADFYSALEKAGYHKKKTNKGSFVYGLALRSGQDFL